MILSQLQVTCLLFTLAMLKHMDVLCLQPVDANGRLTSSFLGGSQSKSSDSNVDSPERSPRSPESNSWEEESHDAIHDDDKAADVATDKTRRVRSTLEQIDMGTAGLFLAAARVSSDRSFRNDADSDQEMEAAEYPSSDTLVMNGFDSNARQSPQTKGSHVPGSNRNLQNNHVYSSNKQPRALTDYDARGVSTSGGHRIRHNRHRTRVQSTPSRQSQAYSVQRPDTNRCPHSGMLRCPSLRLSHKPQVNHNTCIKRQQLCDGFRNCPNGEDEDDVACLFYRATRKVLSQAWDLIEDISQQFTAEVSRFPRVRGGRWRRHRFRRRDLSDDDLDPDDEL